MNNMNEWIPHLQHPLVLAGFGLFVFALIIRPLFLNSKKLTGPLIAPLLRWGMILLFLLAAMAMIGGFALSWKATPAAGSGISLSKEEFRQMLQEDLRTAAKEMQAPGLAAEERGLLELKAKVLEERLADLQKSYEEKLALLKAAEKALDDLKGQLPAARLAEAKLPLTKGDTKAAEQIFEEVAALSNLAALYIAQGRLDEVEPLYRRSLEISEKVLGKEHLNTVTSQSVLAALYQQQGRYREAELLCRRSLEISEKVLGKEHPYVANNLGYLAGLYKAQGKYAEAEPLYKRSLEILEKSLGKEHQHVATTLNNLAGLYESQGRYEEAELLYLRSLSIFKAKLPADHPHIKKVQQNYDALKKKLAGM